MKKLLIISPFFPPSNAADMQRVRMSLPYFKQFGWEAEVVAVDAVYSEMVKDDLLMQSVPADIPIHYVKAFSKGLTSKFGLGSLALRSMIFYRAEVSRILQKTHFDLIYFSTTQFPLCILGAYWKKRFGVPYVIDMQDPWHSEYYKSKPKHERPKKYWFSYRLNKNLEPVAMKSAGGLISVSDDYITDLKTRYPEIKGIPAATITFGAFEPDMQIAKNNAGRFEPLFDKRSVNLVYIGRGGADMYKAVSKLFRLLKKGLEKEPEKFKKLKVYFAGTSYAPSGQARQTIMPVADEFGVSDAVTEITDRISYYRTLATLQQADALFIPGSDDPRYTASKIYPYLLTGKPVLAIFHPESPAIGVLKEYGLEQVYNFENSAETDEQIFDFLTQLIEGKLRSPKLNEEAQKKYSAENMTKRQCDLFDLVLK